MNVDGHRLALRTFADSANWTAREVPFVTVHSASNGWFGIAIDPGYEGELTEDALSRVGGVGRVVDGVQIKRYPEGLVFCGLAYDVVEPLANAVDAALREPGSWT